MRRIHRLRSAASLALAFLAAGALAGCAAVGSPGRVPGTVESRPNILFIYTDDQAPWAVHAARDGHPDLRTPHLDRLIREGAYLPNSFVVTPVCSPSRAQLKTSRYGSELGITDWINARRQPGIGLPGEVPTWPQALSEAGYTVGLLGKWHLGTLPHFHPRHHGFGYFMGFQRGGTEVTDPLVETRGEERRLEGFLTEILTDSAIGFLRLRHAEPFFLSVNYLAPHTPWLPLPEQDWAPYRDLDPWIPNPDYPGLDVPRVKQMMREYLASVASVDRGVGRILQTLDELGLADNTIVIFTSDHGYNMGHNGVVHKGNGEWVLTDPPPATVNIPRGRRPNMYDNSLRVPTMVRWPGVLTPGTVVEETVSNLDWFPTLLAMAGVSPPQVLLRGRDFLPLLRGEHVVGWDNDLYAEYSLHHQAWTHMRAYRTPEWKLVRDFLNEGRDELYHLASDPAERTNLIDSPRPDVQRVVRELDARIVAKMRELGDPVLWLVEPWTAD